MPKKSFALRIDEQTMKAVEKWAADEFRSVNGQLEWMITKMLKDAKRLKKEQAQKKESTVQKIAPTTNKKKETIVKKATPTINKLKKDK